mmetsp:Transcript_885/g.1530  ORF Transcript_885/g.1530 Transcript_885/m.1530 type:complete len:141 (+) Transcript_885:1223-1645(+)
MRLHCGTGIAGGRLYHLNDRTLLRSGIGHATVLVLTMFDQPTRRSFGGDVTRTLDTLIKPLPLQGVISMPSVPIVEFGPLHIQTASRRCTRILPHNGTRLKIALTYAPQTLPPRPISRSGGSALSGKVMSGALMLQTGAC